MPSIVVMRRPVTAESGVMQLRVGLPSTCTVHAPHSAMPQPNFVPVISRKSRNTQSSGVSASASTDTGLPLTLSGVMLVSLWLGEFERRGLTAVLRAGDEFARVVGPEPAPLGISRDRGVHQLAALAFDLADVNAQYGFAVLAEADRPHRAMLELHRVQRFDKSAVVFDPALHQLDRLLQPQACRIRSSGLAARRHLLLALDGGSDAMV